MGKNEYLQIKTETGFGDEEVWLESLAVFPSNCNFGIYYKDTKKGSDSKAADTSVVPMRMNKGVFYLGYTCMWNKKKGEAYPDGVCLKKKKENKSLWCLLWAHTHART